MGRSLVQQLAREGARISTCDVIDENLAETRELVLAECPDTQLTTHHCDVGVEQDVVRFANEVREQQSTDYINLLFNNAGIGGGGGFVNGPREQWERTFAICWYGVYWNCREFMSMLVAAEEGHIINTSSVNGFWASIGPMTSHTSYSTAKFAVKGFSESLIIDLRLNAPHVNVSVVMPGHIGTRIAINSGRIMQGGDSDAAIGSDEELAEVKQRWIEAGFNVHNESLDQIRQRLAEQMSAFETNAPTTADQAANIILDGVRANRWRILVGDDAHMLDQRVRAAPEMAYEPEFHTLDFGSQD